MDGLPYSPGIKQPKFHADRVVPLILKVLHETLQSEHLVLDRPDLFYAVDLDLQHLGLLREGLEHVGREMSSGHMTGDIGMRYIRTQLFNKYDDLLGRLLQTGAFPELQELVNKSEEL